MVDKQTKAALLNRTIERLERHLAVLTRRSDVYAWLRLGILFGGIGASLFLYIAVGERYAVGLFLLTIPAFIAAVVAQRQVHSAVTRYKLWIMLKRQHIARINLDWSHIPVPPFVPVPPEHPFGLDLDLTGKRSISHLLNTAVSYEGSVRLQEWLLTTTPDPVVSYTRQKLAAELVPMVRFRDKLSLNALLSGWRNDRQSAIVQWLQQEDGQNAASLMPWMVILTGLALVNIALWLANTAGLIPAYWQMTGVGYLALYAWVSRRNGNVFATAGMLADEINRLQAVFQHLETYPYHVDTRLKNLVAPFLDRQNRPSAKLRRLGWIMAGASIRGNGVLWFSLNALMPWDLYVAYFFRQMKTTLAVLLPRWLDTWFELEALGSLAAFAWLNPEYTFPELLTGGRLLRGKALGHPLIAADAKVCNDYSIESGGEVDLITGSNMAGKSSFLRTLGVNLCLAYAGGPVNAESLSVSPFRLFSCIRVSDSVNDGVSYFYAEVKRLKLLLNALHQKNALPLFFLIDEIFRGTNNRERLIGSRAYIQGVAGQNGVGLIATHDLELVRLADEMPVIKNYHFEETIIDKQMVFDYRLRTGPSPTTNALKIMAMEGLPVPLQ